MLRALAEKEYTFYMECPPAAAATGGVRSTKAGVLSMETLMGLVCRHASPALLFKMQLLSTMLAFVILHRAGKISNPYEWLYAQLNGGASFIQRMSFCALLSNTNRSFTSRYL